MKNLIVAMSLLIISHLSYAGMCANAFTGTPATWIDIQNNIQANVTGSNQGMLFKGTFSSASGNSGNINGVCSDYFSPPIQLNINVTNGSCAGTSMSYIMKLNGNAATSIGYGAGKGSCATDLMSLQLSFLKQ